MKPSSKSEQTESSGVNAPSDSSRDSRQDASLLDPKSLSDTCTVVLMEELLEERIVKDRRIEHVDQLDTADRRKHQRRESDQL